MENKKIAIIGATGYIGGRLILHLLDEGYHITAVGRSITKLQGKQWAKHPLVTVKAADVLDLDSLKQALEGCSVAYYLVHSMFPEHSDFSAVDRQAAIYMQKACEELAVERIIYLGALGDIDDVHLSKHLRSRSEVAQILASGRTPVTVLRAAMIIGSGSASFEMLRYLVERLPIMVAPRWLHTLSQPIAIRNVLEYLVGCLNSTETIGRSFDIGGPEALSYLNLIEIYAEEAHLLKRWVFTLPWLSLRLSCWWIKLFTPLPMHLIEPLVDGLRNPVLCQNNNIQHLIPQTLLSSQQAIKIAIDRVNENYIETSWSDAGKIPTAEWSNSDDPHWSGGTIYEDRRSITIKAPIMQVWETINKIGGRHGFYYGNWLWHLRSWLDTFVGGVGYGRPRRDESQLRPGDSVQLWRVQSITELSRLVLVAEMKLPGQAILDFRIKTLDDATVEITQIARFLPYGTLGILYWYGISPLHSIIFGGMLRSLATFTLNRKFDSL
ncbi:MAG: NAD-dependent epimerase/dehydratase [Chlamydiales bacterium]|jgi:uncharacterized protein YbjT (DUF2867 family)|nr:NAD-dependent epimerase/dehydratase [Chlamydiales bacterium]